MFSSFDLYHTRCLAYIYFVDLYVTQRYVKDRVSYPRQMFSLCENITTKLDGTDALILQFRFRISRAERRTEATNVWEIIQNVLAYAWMVISNSYVSVFDNTEIRAKYCLYWKVPLRLVIFFYSYVVFPESDFTILQGRTEIWLRMIITVHYAVCKFV